MDRRIIYQKGHVFVALAIVAFVVSLLVSGCATENGAQKMSRADGETPNPFLRSVDPERTVPGGPKAAVEKKDGRVVQKRLKSRTTRQSYTQNRLSKPSRLLTRKARKTSSTKKKRDQGTSVHVELAFDNADLYEVLDATLYELFKVKYMMDPSIKAKASFHLSGNFTKSQFINILNNVLQLNSLAIVKGPGDIYKVVRRSLSAGSGNAPLSLDEETDQAGDITRLIRLKYISSEAGARNIKPFLSKGAVVVQDTVTNSLVITDTADNLTKASSILGVMDVPYFKDISWRVFPVKEVDASEIAKDLSSVLTAGGLYNRPGINKGSFEIIPIKTMNALLAVTRWPSMLGLIEDWIASMDQADDSGMSVHVYFVENGNAVELADILKQLYGGKASGSSRRTSIVKPKTMEPKKGGGELSGEVVIIPDEANNAIVIKATGRDYKMIKDVLSQLDIMPRQVLINVVIAEIKLRGNLKYGVQWYLKGQWGDYGTRGGLFDDVGKSIPTIEGTVDGFALAAYDAAQILRGLILALEDESEINVLSSPNILVVDNKKAIINVGEEIPTATGFTVVEGGDERYSVEYKETGIILEVTPHISSTGLVKMDLLQKVDDLGTEYKALKSHAILKRQASTTLVAEDGQTIVIAGLMKSKQTTSASGIPFLRSIPIIGYLFGGKEKTSDKTELIFLITPNVIETREEADIITREFSRKIEQVKGLIEKKKF